MNPDTPSCTLTVCSPPGGHRRACGYGRTGFTPGLRLSLDVDGKVPVNHDGTRSCSLPIVYGAETHFGPEHAASSRSSAQASGWGPPPARRSQASRLPILASFSRATKPRRHDERARAVADRGARSTFCTRGRVEAGATRHHDNEARTPGVRPIHRWSHMRRMYSISREALEGGRLIEWQWQQLRRPDAETPCRACTGMVRLPATAGARMSAPSSASVTSLRRPVFC